LSIRPARGCDFCPTADPNEVRAVRGRLVCVCGGGLSLVIAAALRLKEPRVIMTARVVKERPQEPSPSRF
jgi:hypothetical protein